MLTAALAPTCLAFATVLCGQTQDRPAAASFWVDETAEALEPLPGKTTRPWVFVYLADRTDPASSALVRDSAWARRAGDRARGLWAKDEEARQYRRYHEVQQTPALLVLDPLGELVQRFEGGRLSARDVLAAFAELEKSFEKALKAWDKAIETAEKSEAGGDTATAIGAAQLVLASSPAAYPGRPKARSLLDRLAFKADEALIQVLALEGLVPDARLAGDLLRLEEFFPLEPLRQDARRERARLVGRKLGGKR